MRLDWTQEEDGSFITSFEQGDIRGTISMRAIHDPIYMQWAMKGKIIGLEQCAIVIRQSVPDTVGVEIALDIFRRTCEYKLLMCLCEKEIE